MLPAAPRPGAPVVIVVTRHGSLYPLPLSLLVQVVWLAGDVAVTRHVAVSDILHVGVDLTYRCTCL